MSGRKINKLIKKSKQKKPYTHLKSALKRKNKICINALDFFDLVLPNFFYFYLFNFFYFWRVFFRIQEN